MPQSSTMWGFLRMISGINMGMRLEQMWIFLWIIRKYLREFNGWNSLE